MDVAGTAEITNRADNVFCVTRGSPDVEAMLDVFKSRFSGRQDEAVALMFDPASRRFRTPTDTDGFNREYGWQAL